MKIALLFSGQGSQKENLGLDIYNSNKLAKKIYDKIDELNGVKQLFYLTDDILKDTKNAQTMIVSFQIMVLEMLKNIKFDAVCGHSVGEFAALYASGVLSLEDTINIIEKRKKFMSDASNKLDSKMYAVMGIEEEELKNILKIYSDDEHFVQISNINTQGQIVISGHIDCIQKVLRELDNFGKKYIELNVSGPFHTKYMKLAEDGLLELFNKIEFNMPKKDLYLNYTGKKYSSGNLKEIMSKQVTNTVLFRQNIENMISDGVEIFIEIGHGKTLSKFIKKIDRNKKIYSIEDVNSLNIVLGELI